MKKFALALALSTVAATAANADGVLTFTIVGDTFTQPYTITNNSTAGETVVAFGMTLKAGFVFDTVTGGIPNSTVGVPFTPVGGTAAITGLNGPVVVADGASSLLLTFTNFNVGESFRWDIDVDSVGGSATVIGNELIGSTGFVDFSNGLRGNGVFEAFGTRGSTFTVTTVSGIPEPATWAMMLIGFAGLGHAARRRKEALAA